MINFAILAILAMVLLLTHGRAEGTIRAPGILAGLTFLRFGRVRVVVWSHRPGRIYYRLALGQGA